MKGTQLDLMAIVVLTLLLQPLVYGVPAEPVRVVLGLLLVLFFPGYTLVSSLYPRREQLVDAPRHHAKLVTRLPEVSSFPTRQEIAGSLSRCAVVTAAVIEKLRLECALIIDAGEYPQGQTRRVPPP